MGSQLKSNNRGTWDNKVQNQIKQQIFLKVKRQSAVKDLKRVENSWRLKAYVQ